MPTTLLPSIPQYAAHFDLLCITSYQYVVHTKHVGDIDDSDSPYDTTLT